MPDAERPYDRRRTPRISLRFPVTLTWGKKKFNCQSMEFSEFGILLALAHKELVGQEVEVALAVDSLDGVSAIKGIVAYSTGTGVGVRFKDLTDDQQSALKKFALSQGKQQARDSI